MNDKTAPLEKMQAQLGKCYIEIDQLKAKAEIELLNLKAYEREEVAQHYYDKLIEELKGMQTTVEKQITELRQTRNGAWAELENSVESTLKAMEVTSRAVFFISK